MTNSITEAQIWSDLDALYTLPDREPGDIDYKMMMEHYGLSQNGARSRMDALVRTGKWELVTVKEDNPAGRINVIRQVK